MTVLWTVIGSIVKEMTAIFRLRSLLYWYYVKMKNVITGGVTETTFNPNDKYPTAYIERKKMEYSYNDGDLYYFMDGETY